MLAFPGDVDRPTSRGCHLLLREGARLCEGAGDVVRALGSIPTPAANPGPEARLLAALGDRPLTAETLARAADLEIEEALAALLKLEWASLATALPGQRWVLNAADST